MDSIIDCHVPSSSSLVCGPQDVLRREGFETLADLAMLTSGTAHAKDCMKRMAICLGDCIFLRSFHQHLVNDHPQQPLQVVDGAKVRWLKGVVWPVVRL